MAGKMVSNSLVLNHEDRLQHQLFPRKFRLVQNKQRRRNTKQEKRMVLTAKGVVLDGLTAALSGRDAVMSEKGVVKLFFYAVMVVKDAVSKGRCVENEDHDTVQAVKIAV